MDKRSGVSQRVPITCLENVVSSAEYRAVKNHEDKAVPRPSDIYTSMPSLTGKVELEYEGEMRGADNVARDIIRQATARVFKKYFDGVPLHSIVQWFELGGTLKYSPNASSRGTLRAFQEDSGAAGTNPASRHQGKRRCRASGLRRRSSSWKGFAALKRISRNEELGYHVEARAPRPNRRTQSGGTAAAIAELRQCCDSRAASIASANRGGIGHETRTVFSTTTGWLL